MRGGFRAAVAAVLLLAAGCTDGHGLLDPSPYEPQADPTVHADSGAGVTAANLLAFPDLDTAAVRLAAMSAGYGRVRNLLAREMARGDGLMLAAAGAAVINPLFSGATQSTLALTLGAGAGAAGRGYLAPQQRLAAYAGAAQSMGCAAGIAAELPAAGDLRSAEATAAELAARLSAARRDEAFKEPGSAMQGAVEDGQAALGALRTALRIRAVAHLRLAAFAGSVVRGTSNRVMTGALNLEAAMTAVRGLGQLPQGGASAPGAGPPASQPQGFVGPPGLPGGDALVEEIRARIAAAAPFTTTVTEIWARLPACAITS